MVGPVSESRVVERPVGLGCFYALLTKMLWPEGEGNEGDAHGTAGG